MTVKRLLPVTATAERPAFPSRDDHPVVRQGIERASSAALSTNKFYANMFLGDRTQAVWLHPFSVWWSKEGPSWGLSISHVEPAQRAFGPDPNANPVQFYFNPIRIQSFCLSAVELSGETADMTLSDLDHMSVQLNFRLRSDRIQQNMRIPLIQGSGFISAIYNDLTPRFDSGVMFRHVSPVMVLMGNIFKWRIQLEDGHIWVLYAVHLVSWGDQPNLIFNPSRLEFDKPFTGTIQVTKIPGGDQSFEAVIDKCAGIWATSVDLSASYNDKSASATYTFDYQHDPNSRSGLLLMYAFPHHVESFIPETSEVLQYKLNSTTKGPMHAVISNRWYFKERIPGHISFSLDSFEIQSESEKQIIARVAREEAQDDPSGESNQPSMYFSGKSLDKYACMCWVICEVLKDTDLAQNLLKRVKDAFSRFAENRQRFPLVYESAWGGLVSSAMYETGDLMQDFGNGCYNDHHFHYGYFIHAAALIAEMDRKLGNGSSWLDHNRVYVDALVRDTNNANPSDQYYPLSRAFDWYHGHSWAKGLFESSDGKDQESTSEDAYYSYGLSLWGLVTGDEALQRRASLMLAIQKRVFSSYFLMENKNRNQPPNFVLNKVTGILFENKCDHTTYFGNDVRFIQGIHMIPLSPISHYIRSPTFIREEWERYFAQDPLTGDDGWKGILYANHSIIEPKKAWSFFASDQFKSSWLDGGASRTWYLWLCLLHEALSHQRSGWHSLKVVDSAD